jgi:biopolymer transport protein TolR
MRFQTLNSVAFVALFLILAVVPAAIPLTSRGFPVVVAFSRLGECGDGRIVIVEVLRGGSLRLNSEDVKRDLLETRLHDIFQTRVERVVFIRADPEVPYGQVAEAIDVASRQVDYVAILPHSVRLGLDRCLSIPVKPGEFYRHSDRPAK